MSYKPRYTITPELLTRIATIESLRTKVENSYILPEREIELRHRATVEATHSSTSIEGNPLDYRQVSKALGTAVPLTRHEYAEREVRNYGKALSFIARRKKTKRPITMTDILQLHAIIMEGLLPDKKAGTIRENDVYIVNQDEVTQYVGPKPQVVHHELEQLLIWLEQETTLHPVVVAAILHFQFVSIHPFSDGNGRTTRVLVSLYLGLQDYDFRGALVLDTYYATARREYYSALHTAQGAVYATAREAELTPWIQYFTEGFLSSARVLFAEVTVLASIVTDIPKRDAIRSDEADLLAYAKQFGELSLSTAESILPNIPRRTLQRKLSDLVEHGYLTIEGKARNTKYVWADQKPSE